MLQLLQPLSGLLQEHCFYHRPENFAKKRPGVKIKINGDHSFVLPPVKGINCEAILQAPKLTKPLAVYDPVAGINATEGLDVP